jgi:hypothetical protein
VDTPEVTARTAARATEIDQEFVQLAEWITQEKAPIEAGLAEFLLPKLSTGRAGSLHFEQGQQASAFGKQNITTRLARPNGKPRAIFIRVADAPFDNNHPTTPTRNAATSPNTCDPRSTLIWSSLAGPPRSSSTRPSRASRTWPC